MRGKLFVVLFAVISSVCLGLWLTKNSAAKAVEPVLSSRTSEDKRLLQLRALAELPGYDPQTVPTLKRRALAELYVKGAVASLKAGDSIQAAMFLRESRRLTPDLEIQQIVRSEPEKRAEPAVPSKKLEQTGRPPSVAEELSWSMIVMVFFVCAALPAMVFCLLSQKRFFRHHEARAILVTHRVLQNDIHAEDQARVRLG